MRRREIKWIYGLKGVGAFSVVMLHMLACMFPAVHYAGTQYFPGTQIYNFVQLTPVGILFNGSFAVYVFWTLSAFLMTYSYLNNRGDNAALCRKIVSKFVRIFSIALLVSIIAFALLKNGGYHHLQAGSLIDGSFWINERDYSDFGRQMLFWDVLWRDWQGTSFLIPPLWTMYYEFLGSIMLCALLATGQVDNLPLTALMGLLLVGIKAPLICFLFGMLIAAGYHKDKGIAYYGLPIFLAGVCMGAYPPTGTPADGVYWFIYEKIIAPYNAIIPGESGVHMWYVIASALIVYGTMKSGLVKKVMSNRVFVFAGKLSMYTYICHIPILWSFVAWLYYTLETKGGDHTKTVVLCYLLGLAAIYICAYVVKLVYDRLLSRLADKVTGFLVR